MVVMVVIKLSGHVFIDLIAVDPANHRSSLHGSIDASVVLLVTCIHDATSSSKHVYVFLDVEPHLLLRCIGSQGPVAADSVHVVLPRLFLLRLFFDWHVWLQKSFHFRAQVRTLSQLVVHVLDSIICLHPRVCLEQLLDLWEHLFSIVVEVTIADYRDHDAIEFTKLLQ